MSINKLDKIKQYLCAILLALGGVTWFANITLGVYKSIITFILVLVCYKYFIRQQFKQIKYVLLLVIFTVLSSAITLHPNAEYNYMFIYGLVEYIVYLVIGYNFAKNHLITDKFVYLIIFTISIFCFLTVTNYLFNIPNWVSPVQTLRIENLFTEHGLTNIEAARLYSTGFGLGRTGWTSSICLFIPLSFLCILRKYKLKTSLLFLFIIFLSIFVSGSRGGLLTALFLLFLFFIYTKKTISSRLQTVIIVLVIPILFMIGLLYENYIIEHLRLDSEDITTGRASQYDIIPYLIETMGFWGHGIGGASFYSYEEGTEHTIHNSYFRNLIEFGWIVGILIFIYSIYLIRFVHTTLKHNNIIFKVFPLVIISGLVSAIFEPGAVYGTRTWYNIWWFSLGVMLYYKNLNYSTSYTDFNVK